MSGTNQQQEIDYASIMLQFNNDPDFIKLRDRYATKSFLEIMSTDRSETRHSSFLAWLLEGKDFPVKEQDHPIIHLLDILIRRESEQSSTEQSTQKLVPDDIKNMVLSRNIKSIQISEVSTEKLIRDLSRIQSIDRLDIYIHCTIESKNGQSKEIKFIIENKVGSKENGAKTGSEKKQDKKVECDQYYDKTQTQRYYYALLNDNENKNARNEESTKIFIYLTPISNADLSDFDNLGEDQKSKDGHFININYQDILDNIIEPLLSSEDISTRIHTLLEEYVLSLSLPALIENENEQNIKGSIIMATRQEDIENIENIIKKNNYLLLIKNALKETISKSKKTNAALLQSFGETYRKLFTAILRVYIETGDKQGDELDELQDLYYQLLGTPKDNTKFSITYKNNPNDNINTKGKRVFAIAMLKAYINYYQNIISPTDICKELHIKYFPNDTQQNKQYKLYIVLLNNWYEKKEGEKYWYKKQGNEVPDNINIPPKIDSSRYEIFEPFLITNQQWGIDANAEKDSSFVKLLEDICGPGIKELIKTTQKLDASYDIDKLQNNWNKILTNADMAKITIHINKK